jgi:two-component system chemotaxis response regulator CheY
MSLSWSTKEMMRSLLRRLLKDAGFSKVREAEGGEAALALLSDTPADLIFADHSMPSMNGPSFIAAVRANTAFGTPRVIMISGITDPHEHRAARDAGADIVLIKPVKAPELFRAIEQAFA